MKAAWNFTTLTFQGLGFRGLTFQVFAGSLPLRFYKTFRYWQLSTGITIM